jgi:PHP family Zn ribbon phosphoesterase
LTVFSDKCGRGLSKALTLIRRSNVDIAELKVPWIRLYVDVLAQGGANVTLHGLSVVKHEVKVTSVYCPAHGQTPWDGPIPRTEELHEKYKTFIDSTEFFLRN